MGEPIDFSSWVAGWTSLAFVIVYGIYILARADRHQKALSAIPTRVLVTGSRGKSGTVRLIYQIARESGKATYAKVTGTTAVELIPAGEEIPTRRYAAASVSEMPDSLIRAKALGAEVGVFECMAVSPELIKLVQESHVKSDIAVIPAIRLDHLEEEGLTEQEIARNIVKSLSGCKHLVVGTEQPEVLEVIKELCAEKEIAVVQAQPSPDQPKVQGHHPTNVAVALEVAKILGFPDEAATAALSAATLEPRTLTMLVVEREGGQQIGLIDLGGANDPQSSFEAINALGLTDESVIPILINRWERPLRSLVFMSAVLGRFPRVGVAGPLSLWTKFFHRRFPEHSEHSHTESAVVTITGWMARNPEMLARKLFDQEDSTSAERITLLLLENTHERVADLLRKTFETKGKEILLTDWLARV